MASSEGLGFSGELPRFGTSYHSTPLTFEESTGRSSVKVAEYSTRPRAFRGARRISLTTALSGILRVEFAVEMSREALVLRNGTNLFAMLHDETDDAGRGRGAEQNEQAQSAHQAPFPAWMGIIRRHVCPQW